MNSSRQRSCLETFSCCATPIDNQLSHLLGTQSVLRTTFDYIRRLRFPWFLPILGFLLSLTSFFPSSSLLGPANILEPGLPRSSPAVDAWPEFWQKHTLVADSFSFLEMEMASTWRQMRLLQRFILNTNDSLSRRSQGNSYYLAFKKCTTFFVVLEFWTHGLELARQALYHLSSFLL
jgi:hypothetical protein